ncbi:MAG: hypothetical protein ACREBS_08475 [Nitrososphaerales archaeon]
MPSGSKKCPMCETRNDENAQSCKYCGYIFEDFSTPQATTQGNGNRYPAPSKQEEEEPAGISTAHPLPSTENTLPAPSPSATISTGSSPLFVVSRSVFSSVAPAILIYLVLFTLATSMAGLDLFSVSIIIIFILISILSFLFSTRRYEFYDSSLRMHKIIGGDSEVSYDDLEIYDSPTGRRARIILSAKGHRRPMAIPRNPTNKELGQDLNQFLRKKLKKYSPETARQQSTPSSDAADTQEGDDKTTSNSTF